MGFFAPKCKCCGLSAISQHTVQSSNLPSDWMTRVVAIVPQEDGSSLLVTGSYNGCGRIETENDVVEIYRSSVHKWPAVYHNACWLAAGSPSVFDGESPDSSDQGFFIDSEVYAKATPP